MHVLLKIKGFSTLEVLLAGAIFVVFSWGVIEILLTGLTFDRYSRELTLATTYATEGVELVRALRQEGFDALELTEATGISLEAGSIHLSGESTRLSDTYVRTVALKAVERGAEGSIVESDGTIDVDTIRAVVTVTWERSPVQTESVVLETILTRWQ